MDANQYTEAAELALTQAGATLTLVLSDTQRPRWAEKDGPYQPHWKCTLASSHGSYTFDFWDSIHNGAYTAKDRAANAASRNKPKPVRIPPTPTSYDVITCLEWNDPGAFEQWCDESGYDQDSRKAHAIWVEVGDMFRNLCRVIPRENARNTFALIQ